MDGRTFFIFLLSIAWILLCQRWYCCWMQVACTECSNEPINTLAIGFLSGSNQPDTTATFAAMVKKFQQDRPENSYLEVSGRYNSDELYEGVDELGISRAQNTLALLRPFFPKDSISIRSQKLLPVNTEYTGYQQMVELQWLPILETPKPIAPEKVILYFENGKTRKEISKEEEEKIADLIAYAVSWKKNILVHGHSDKSGDQARNIFFSQKRAKFAKEYLTQKGFSENQIIINQFGSTKPLDINNRAMNRRVEIYISN